MNHYITLEFDEILRQLAENALSDVAKKRCLALGPSLNEAAVKRSLAETTQAKQIIQNVGMPPLPAMTQLQKIITLVDVEAILVPEQIEQVASFATSCRRMKAYLRKAEVTESNIAWTGGAINELTALEKEIEQSIRNGAVDDKASAQLTNIRRKKELVMDEIKARLEAMLRKNRAWFQENFVSIRNGHYTLPVKRGHKNDVPGTVVDTSQTGGTLFIEPAAVGRLQTELAALQFEEDNEIRRILYSLTALIAENLPAIRSNMETLEQLDFLFAKGKLSLAMKASPVGIHSQREIWIRNARHPLLEPDKAVPLHFEVGPETLGVIITGPNTGGKTVALKTVGLLSLMAQSGLHVPADGSSRFCLYNLILCDIGDKQSIAENLSTFSSHMKNIIGILDQANEDSLVLLDELGSGTDPAEGMGLAVAILDELIVKRCLFVVTTHYPEIKDYAEKTPELVNARMAFDRESLLPLYRLELGKAGESCALYIAEKLGMGSRILKRAREAAYGISEAQQHFRVEPEMLLSPAANNAPRIERQQEQTAKRSLRNEQFNIGDSVKVYPQKEIGIVYARSNERGEIGVQVKGRKQRINHKRLKLLVAADELYPDNYDFSILFDSVVNRKARKLMEKRHEPGNIIVRREDDDPK